MKKAFAYIFIIAFVMLNEAQALEAEAPPFKKGGRCPVCGMYVAPYADWNGTVEFSDSTRVVMDGPKDAIKYYRDVGKYNSSKSREDIASITVRDYVTKTEIDAGRAYYVIWSDVYGPMGHEPIPFSLEEEAMKFLREHHGKKVIRFDDITLSLLHSLDNP